MKELPSKYKDAYILSRFLGSHFLVFILIISITQAVYRWVEEGSDGWKKEKNTCLLYDLLEFPVLALELSWLFVFVVVCGGAGFERVLLFRLPLATSDQTTDLQKQPIRFSFRAIEKNPKCFTYDIMGWLNKSNIWYS